MFEVLIKSKMLSEVYRASRRPVGMDGQFKLKYKNWLLDKTQSKPKSTKYRHLRQERKKNQLPTVQANHGTLEESEEIAQINHQSSATDADPDFEIEQLEQMEQSVHSDEYADQLESDEEHWHNAEQMEQEPNATSYCDTEPAFFEPVNSSNNPPKEGGLFEETLCGCTSMTAGDVFLMTVGLGLRHNLTWAAQVDILKMVNQLFNVSPLKATKYYYEKYVCSGNIAVDTYLYCPDCGVSLGKVEQQLNPNIVCTCKKIVSKQSTLFLSLSLEDQFKNLLRDPVFAKDLMSHRFDREKNGDDSLLRDIFDGAAYRKLFDRSGPLSKPENFSLSFNTDGVSAGKSNSVNRTMWPILVTINELPYNIRNKYVLLAGLYVGKTHPNMDEFLQPFVAQLNRLSSAGFEWINSDHKQITSRVYPLCAVVDSPARSAMLRMNASNSLYGCTFCLQKTVRTTSGRRFAGDKFGELRSHNSIKKDMETALANCEQSDPRSKGVWAPSILLSLESFDLGQGFAPDYLHAVLLGCVKQHTELLLTPLKKKRYWIYLDVTEDIGLDHVIALVDKKIDKIVVPHCITRLPRGLKDRESWKASEWRSWLLFYCLVCLQGQLKKKYLIHLAHLCVAMHILLQKSISPSQLRYAEELLIKYVVLYEEYFSDVSMNYCIHLLTHLVDGVRNFGPLFTHNTFLYEGQNRFLLQLLSSPFCVTKQLAKKYTTFSCLPELCSKLASSEKSADFCASIVGRQLSNFVRSGDTVLLGKGTACTLTEEERLCLQRHNIAVEFNVQNFNRFIHKGSRYCTRAYAKKNDKKNDDSIVYTTSSKYFVIENMLLFPQNTVYIFGRQVICDSFLSERDLKVSHISTWEETSDFLTIIDPNTIICQCILIEGKILCQIPFGCFGD